MNADRAVPAFRGLAILLLAGAAFACHQPAPQSQAPAELRVEVLDGASMGTTYTVRVVTEDVWDEARRDRVGGRVQMALDDVEAAMSHYQPESEVSRFNALRSTDVFELSAATFEVVRVALELSELSRGALDITVAPLVNAWGFGPTEPEMLPPDPGVLSRLRDHVGFRKLELDEAISTVRKTNPALEWDLSSVAKGYGVDQVAAVLADEGLTRFMVEVGGEIVLYIQCKNYVVPVGVEHIRQLNGVLPKSKPGSQGVVTCPAGFTQDARRFAEERGIALWDRLQLFELGS